MHIPPGTPLVNCFRASPPGVTTNVRRLNITNRSVFPRCIEYRTIEPYHLLVTNNHVHHLGLEEVTSIKSIPTVLRDWQGIIFRKTVTRYAGI